MTALRLPAPAFALALALLLPFAPDARAASLSDLIMKPGLFAAAPDGVVVAYDHVREAPDYLPRADLADGRLVMTAKEGERGRTLALTRREKGQDFPVAEFPASGGNPVLLYFLETTARNMAEATGGSPFYIRNRMREALEAAQAGAEGVPAATAIRPFVQDPNRGRMGIFGDLVISLRYDPAEPGRLLELSADTAPGAQGYHDRMVLIAEE